MPHTTVYRSKIDAWLLVVLAAGMAVTAYGAFVVLAGGFPGAWSLAVLIAGAGIGLPLWFLLSTRYELDPRHLVVRSGPFTWRIPLAEITGITPTTVPLSSPALSLDRLRIDYGRGRSLMISPRDKERFLREVEVARRGAV